MSRYVRARDTPLLSWLIKRRVTLDLNALRRVSMLTRVTAQSYFSVELTPRRSRDTHSTYRPIPRHF